MAVDPSFHTSPLSEEIRDEGRAEGRAEGLADAVLLVPPAARTEVPDEACERITACDDPQLVRTWLGRAVTGASIEAIFTDE